LSNPLQIALQLWTVRSLADADLLAALHQVGALGYRAVEFAGFGTAAPATIGRGLAECGLRAASTHVGFDALTQHLESVIADMRVIGCPCVVVPAFAPQLRTTLEDALRLAEMLNQIGERLVHAGLALAYHNEDYDFAPLGTSTLWDVLVAHTDPGLVQLQLDIFTAHQMGRDIFALMRDHGSRITSYHVCDIRADRYVPVGQGEFDWPALMSAMRATSGRWLIVEHDAPPDPLEDARTSRLALERFGMAA
jgi:sugar phosphate isomerase/epimerase